MTTGTAAGPESAPEGAMPQASDDPDTIARYLVRQHGRAGAQAEAARLGYAAQSEGRYYDLSIWREVKRILRDLRDEAV